MITTLRRILPRQDARALTGLVSTLTVSAILQGITLGLVVPFITTLFGAAPHTAWGWLGALGAACAGYVIVQWMSQMQAFRVGSETARALHRLLAEHIAILPLGWFTPERRARLTEINTAGVPQLMSYPAILLRPLIAALVTPAAAAIVLAIVADWRYGFALLSAVAIAERAGTIGRRRAQDADAARHRAQDAAATRILEFAHAQPLLRTQHGTNARDELDAAFVASAGIARRTIRAVTPGLVAFTVTVHLLFAALILIGLTLVTGGEFSVAAFAGAMIVTTRLIGLASAGAELATTARMHATQLIRITDVLDAVPLTILPTTSTIPPSPAEDTIAEFRNVSFGYGETAVLADVSFTLPRRGMTAIVGPSGAGKSTIARLLLRFSDPDSGTITINGTDIRTLEPNQLYSHVSAVLQDVWLTDGTIEDNVRTGRPDATGHEVRDALRRAALTDADPTLPNGPSTAVGPGGRLLSGGQRQRVSIARALLSNTPLTILDEATSALDPTNAALITSAARALAARSAVLIIAHNPATIAAADTVLRLRNGLLVADTNGPPRP